jgi:hypothetical protein
MLKKHTTKLLLLLLIFSVVLPGYYLSTNDMVVAKLVDYQCNPIINTPVVISRDLGSFPLGWPISKTDKIKTDEDGFFKFKANARSIEVKKDIHDLNNYRRFRNDQWGSVRGKIQIDITNELKRSSYKSPLFIYVDKDLPPGIKHGYDSDLIRIRFTEKTAQMLPASFGSTPGNVVNLSWKIENDRPHIWITGIGNGGVLDITNKTELLNRIPTKNYSKSLNYEITDSTFRRIFLVKGKANQSYSIYSIDLVYDKAIKVAYLSTLLNTIAVDKYSQNGRVSVITKPVIPRENCGGVFARSHNGYFGLLDNEELNYLKATTQERPLELEKSNSEIQKIAAHPETPLEWYKENTDNQLIAKTALDNNGDINNRIEYIYKKSKDNNWHYVIETISKDIRTTESILLDIVNNYDKFTSHVASNPSSTIKVLDRILDKLSNELNTTDSKRKHERVISIIQTLARKENIPPVLLEKAHKIIEKYIRLYMMKNSSFSSVEISLIRNKQATSNILSSAYDRTVNNKLIDIYSHQSKDAWKAIAEHNNASSDSLKSIIKLLISEEFNELTYKILHAAITNKNLHKSHKRELYKIDNKYLNLIFAELEDTPKDILIKLSKKNDKRINMKLAKNTTSPDSILRKLASQKYYYESVKMAIAENPNTPIDVLHELSSIDEVLSHMIDNPSIDEMIISKLKKKAYYANHIATTREKILKSLNKIDSSGKIIKRFGYYSLHTILKIDELSSDIILRIYNYRYSPVTHLIAHHKNTPPNILEKVFSESENISVIKALASNPNTPIKILENIFEGNYLITDKSFTKDEVEDHLYCNRNLPINLRKQLHYKLDLNCERIEKRLIR